MDAGTIVLRQAVHVGQVIEFDNCFGRFWNFVERAAVGALEGIGARGEDEVGAALFAGELALGRWSCGLGG